MVGDQVEERAVCAHEREPGEHRVNDLQRLADRGAAGLGVDRVDPQPVLLRRAFMDLHAQPAAVVRELGRDVEPRVLWELQDQLVLILWLADEVPPQLSTRQGFRLGADAGPSVGKYT